MSNLLDFHQCSFAYDSSPRFSNTDTLVKPVREFIGMSIIVAAVHGSTGGPWLGYPCISVRTLAHPFERRADRVIAPELLGHGFSDKPIPRLPPSEVFARMARMLDQTDEPLTVVGTSLGGAIALKYIIVASQGGTFDPFVSPAGAPLTPEGFEKIRSHFTLKDAADGRAFIDADFTIRLGIGSLEWRLGAADVGTVGGKRFSLSCDEKRDVYTETVAPLAPPTLLIWGAPRNSYPQSVSNGFVHICRITFASNAQLDLVTHLISNGRMNWRQ